MPANTSPIFPVVPNVGWGKLLTANTAKDGTGTVVTVFTAGANGARVDEIRVRALGTNVATALRVFQNNGSTNATATNNTLIAGSTIAAATISEVAEFGETIISINKSIPAGHVINITIGTTVAAGLQVTCYGGDY